MRFAWILVGCLALGGSAWAGTDPQIFAPAVADLSDPDAVLEAMRAKGASELPLEALTQYRMGLESIRNGDRRHGMEQLELAAALDPAFPEPHVALARLTLFSDPPHAFVSLTGAVRAFFASFGAQHLLLVNVLFGLLLGGAAGGFLVGAYAAVRLLPRVNHSVGELGRRWFPPVLASLLAAVLFAVPLLWRVGLIPVLLLFCGLMWSWMHRNERVWVMILGGLTVVAPALLWVASPLVYSPLDPAERPVLMGRAQSAPYSSGLVNAVAKAQERHPEDASLTFSLGLLEKRGGHLDAAEAAYSKALRLGAPPAQVYNNLGVIAFERGNYERATELLLQSVEENPKLAAPHFNLSQAFSKRLFFERADFEMREANRISFDRVRAALRHRAGSKRPVLIDEPLPPSSFWAAAWAGPRRIPELPRWMGVWYPGSFVTLGPVSVFLFAIGFVLGRRLYRTLPSFSCANCGQAVCRRCLRRIRRAAYCTPCGDALLRIQSAAYSKLVLDSRLRRQRTLPAALEKLGVWLLPGYHAVQVGRIHVGSALALGTAFALQGVVHHQLPVTRLAWIENGPGLWWPELWAAGLVLCYALSGITVLKLKPVRDETAAKEPEPGERPEGEPPLPHGRAAA